MNPEVDQFGRSTNNSDGLSDEKSKRILEALSDIKNQLQNDEFIPKVEKENLSKPKETKKDIDHDLDLKNLHYKIESLEKKINQIVENLYNKQKNNFSKEDEEEDDKSIFHKIENNKSDQEQSKSILVLDNQNLQNISSFKFYHFLILLIILITALTLITSKKLGLSISESLNFFISLFN